MAYRLYIVNLWQVPGIDKQEGWNNSLVIAGYN